MPRVNEKVNTPIGQGVVQGPFGVNDGNGEAVVRGVLVRLPVDDATRSHLKKSFCVTPNAEVSALFVFQEGQLSAISR